MQVTRKKSEERVSSTMGFTLVELLASIAVLAILIALLLAGTSRFVESGRSANCMANMRQLNAALFAYAGEHRGFLPKAYANDTPLWWAEVLADQGYIPPIPANSRRPNSILFCPSSQTYKASGSWYWANGNYGINQHLAGSDATPSNPVFDPAPLQALSRPSTMILLLDSGVMSLLWTVPQSPAPDVFYVPGSKYNENVQWPKWAKQDALEGRHDGKVHVSYADGHIETQNAADLKDYRLWLNQ